MMKPSLRFQTAPGCRIGRTGVTAEPAAMGCPARAPYPPPHRPIGASGIGIVRGQERPTSRWRLVPWRRGLTRWRG
jgi:hypothetical protein